MPDDGYSYDLVDGDLVRMTPAGAEHGAVTACISQVLREYVEEHGGGVCCGADTGFILRRTPDLVRAPAAAFVSAERVPKSGIPKSYSDRWRRAAAVSVRRDAALSVVRSLVTGRSRCEALGSWMSSPPGCRGTRRRPGVGATQSLPESLSIRWCRCHDETLPPQSALATGSRPVSAIVDAVSADDRKSMSLCAPSGFSASVVIPVENVVTLWYSSGMGPT